jgi:hypothetical protein
MGGISVLRVKASPNPPFDRLLMLPQALHGKQQTQPLPMRLLPPILLIGRATQSAINPIA